MALKMEVTCSRCKKTHMKTVDTVAEGQAFEALEKKKGERLTQILKFFEGIPDDELPDFMVVGGGGTGLVHVSLCDPEDKEKRSCKKRIAEVLKQAAELEERKPRSSNKKALATMEALNTVLAEQSGKPIPLTVEKK